MKLWNRRSGDERVFEDVLAECLETVAGPDGIAACLRRYPEYAERLAPLLETAQATRLSLAAPIREDRRVLARRQFLQAAAQQSQAAPSYVVGRVPSAQRTPSVLLRPLWSTFAPAIVAAALFIIALVPILGLTSSSALPGDWNYGFKRSSERVRLALALDPADRFNLQVAFHQRRVREVERLASSGRYDPSLLRALNNETEALLNTVSNNRALGPSEAEKVVQVTDVQAQVLQNQIEPNAPPAIKQDVAAVVAQSQQIQVQAVQVVQAKKDEAVAVPATAVRSRGATPAPTVAATPVGGANSTASATPNASATATAAATGKPTATVAASETATPTPVASATAARSATPVETATATGTVEAASSATATRPIVIVAVPSVSTARPAVGTPVLSPAAAPTTPAPILVPSAPPATPARSSTASVAAATPSPSEGAILVPAEPAASSATATVPVLPEPEQTPVRTPNSTPAPTHIPVPTVTPPLPTPPPPPPTPTPSPTPVVPPSQPPAGSQQGRAALPAGGSQSFVYNGPETTVPDALASIAGQYEAVYITQPKNNGGHVYPYYPGVSDPATQIQPGSLVTIVTKPGVQPILISPTGAP